MPGALTWVHTIGDRPQDISLSGVNVMAGPAFVVFIMIARYNSAKTMRELEKKKVFITQKFWGVHSIPGAT